MPTTTVAAFPGSTTLLTGTVNAGTVAALASDNNVYYAVNSTTSGTRTSAWYGSFPGVARALSNLRVSYSGNNSRNTTQTISIWSWSTGAWVQLDSRTVGTAEVAINNLVPTGTLARIAVLRYLPTPAGPEGDWSLRIRGTGQRYEGPDMESKRRPLVSGDIVMISRFDKTLRQFETLSTSGASGVIPARSDADNLFRPPDKADECQFFVIKNA